MKMKEQNAWLSLMTFIQLIVMASSGAVVNEFLKDSQNNVLIVLSLLVGTVAFAYGIRIYRKFFVKVKKGKN